MGLDSSASIELRHVNSDVAGSNPALVIFSLFNPELIQIYPVSFPWGLLIDKKKITKSHDQAV